MRSYVITLAVILILEKKLKFKMKFVLLSVFVILSAIVSIRKCAKILVVIPTPSISHQVPFRPLTQELVRRGHQVTVITTDPAFPKNGAPKNLTEIDVHDISYKLWREGTLKHVKGNKGDQIAFLRIALNVISDVLDQQFQTEEIQNLIHGNDEFDLLITEIWYTGLLALTHRFKAPLIQMSSMGGFYISNRIFGIPIHPLLYPQPAVNQRIYNLTLWEKIEEVYNFFQTAHMFNEISSNQDKFIRKYFDKDLPSMEELMNRVEMLFLNVHPIFEGSFPVPPSVVYVWGIDKKPEKEIPKDLKSYMDSSKHGVIYMSFGTNTDPANLPSNTIQTFISVFSKLPYDVLWKWSKDDLPGKSDNIRIQKWFPQSDLLRHPKIKLFITQGGLQSSDEAISAGVPLVGIPMLADQWYNVEKYVHFGIGEKLDVETLTEDKFKNAIETVIGSDSYRKNIEKLRNLMKDEPQPPLERAVWWVEYVLRHGGARHLRAPAANISWAHYFELELVLAVLSGVIIVMSILAYSLYILYSFLLKGLGSKVKTKIQ